MMTYITENPWPLILIFFGIAFIAFLTASPRSGTIAMVCLLLSVGLFFLERYLVSPREEVTAEVKVMLENFKDRNIDAIAAQISATKRDLVTIAERGLELVELSPSFHIRSAEAELLNDNTAIVLVRANGTVSLLNHSAGPRHVATYWKLTWKREDGRWKLSAVQRLNVTTGEELDYFSTASTSLLPQRLDGGFQPFALLGCGTGHSRFDKTTEDVFGHGTIA